MCSIILHQEQLQGKIQEYFPSINLNKYQQVRNPFVQSDKLDTTILSCQEEDDLTDIRNNEGLKNMFQEITLDKFWIHVQTEYTAVASKVIRLLLQFSTLYLCEVGFSRLTIIKSQSRERLLIVEEEKRVALTTIFSNIKKICQSYQAQPSY